MLPFPEPSGLFFWFRPLTFIEDHLVLVVLTDPLLVPWHAMPLAFQKAI